MRPATDLRMFYAAPWETSLATPVLILWILHDVDVCNYQYHYHCSVVIILSSSCTTYCEVPELDEAV